ncbi:MAG: DUF6263 family protein [Bacteroidales bacterium]|jgi:hypothetical protein|nr:DUF6263 family protein [Bacteroidales bacterium]MCU0407444.1 DUF6263 family protein [Bacteroidales bacterium]
MKSTLVLFAAAMICSAGFGQNSATLRLNPVKNTVCKMHSVSEQTIVQTINGNQQTIESASEYAISMKMIDSSPSFIVAEVRIDSFSIGTNTMGKIEKMSSSAGGSLQAENSPEVISYFMNRITKSPLYVKLDFTGKATEIVNAKMVSDMILRDTGSISLPGQLAPAAKAQVAKMAGDNSFKSIIDMFTFCLPGKEVRKGESWSFTTTSNSGGMMLEITSTYKLEGTDGQKANVSAESNIRAAANAIPMESGGARITYDDFKGLSKASLVIDTNTGIVIENSAKTRLAGILGISVAGMNMQMPMEINGTSRITALQ